MTDERLERDCTRFLYLEAELLDQRRLRDWFELLSPQIEYRVPVRTQRHRKDGSGFSERAFFLEEDYGSIRLRVNKLESDFAWAENPPSRTRRLVGNVRVQGVLADGGIQVASNLALYCYRGESPTPVTITGERRDVLAPADGGLRLKNRLVLLDTTVLGLESLSFFL